MCSRASACTLKIDAMAAGSLETGSPWAGVDPNGRDLDIDAVLFLRLEDGFVIEADELFDSAVLAEQLGFRPGDTSAAARVKCGLGRLRSRLGSDS